MKLEIEVDLYAMMEKWDWDQLFEYWLGINFEKGTYDSALLAEFMQNFVKSFEKVALKDHADTWVIEAVNAYLNLECPGFVADLKEEIRELEGHIEQLEEEMYQLETKRKALKGADDIPF